jgi:hypothetical protein
MNEAIIEFQKQRIVALEAENQRLKQAFIRKESSLKAYLLRLQEIINDDAFNKPIHNINYNQHEIQIRG